MHRTIFSNHAENPAKACPEQGAGNGGGRDRIIMLKLGEAYQAEKYIGAKVFHENLAGEAVPAYIRKWLPEHFLRLNAFSEASEFALMVSKGGGVRLLKSGARAKIRPREGHDREKKHIFPEGAAIAPLVDMGVFTAEGRVVKAMHDKYRQINRFVEAIDDELSKRDFEQIRVIDYGCGKGYLTFLLYYYLTRVKNIRAEMIGVTLIEVMGDAAGRPEVRLRGPELCRGRHKKLRTALRAGHGGIPARLRHRDGLRPLQRHATEGQAYFFDALLPARGRRPAQKRRPAHTDALRHIEGKPRLHPDGRSAGQPAGIRRL
jgi:hypothetical protein